MKLSKNTFIAASMTLAIALGCVNLIDTNVQAPVANTDVQHSEIAKADVDTKLFNVGAQRPDLIIVIPD